MLWCLCEWERDVLCLCCAFSAVLSGFGHSLPCEACRENVSHGVIVTNPPPHSQPPFSSSIPPPITMACRPCPFFSPIRPQSESRISCFLCTVQPWQYRRHPGMCDWVELVMWLFSLSGDCHVDLSHFPVSVTAVESLVISVLVSTASWSVAVCLCSSPEYPHIVRKHTVAAGGQDVHL